MYLNNFYLKQNENLFKEYYQKKYFKIQNYETRILNYFSKSNINKLYKDNPKYIQKEKLVTKF